MTKIQECSECGELTYNVSGICTACLSELDMWGDDDLFDDSFWEDDDAIRLSPDGVLRITARKLG